MRIVVVGGGVAGLYFTYRLLQHTSAEVVVIDYKDFHEFPIGIPMAFAGLVEFQDLVFPFKEIKRAQFVSGRAVVVEGRCVRISSGAVHSICGDYVVLAPGGYKVGSAEYWSVGGAQELYSKVVKAAGVRFIANDFNPVIGFQELAYSIKTRFPEKDVSVHLVYISDDYAPLLEAWRKWAEQIGIEVSEELPRMGKGDLSISVPVLRPHPLAVSLEVDPATFETQYERVYLIGDSSLVKLGLPPIGWGALWQASTLAKALAQELKTGAFEVEMGTWTLEGDKDKFLRWFIYKMTTGTPLAHLKGLYDLWKDSVWKSLTGGGRQTRQA
ncbi:MAG: NAD(P)/FAD-dependent oxidoreductase [Pyrobaculum sp.]